MDLQTLRTHVDQWGGLNAEDARALIDLMDEANLAPEYGYPVDADADPNAVTSDRIEFIPATQLFGPDGPDGEPWAEPIYYRLVSPWMRAR